MIDGQAVVGGVVAVDVQQQFEAVAVAQIGIARAARFGRRVVRTGRFAATGRHKQELAVIRQHHGGRPVGIVGVRAGQRGGQTGLPGLVVQAAVQMRPLARPATFQIRLGRAARGLLEPQFAGRTHGPGIVAACIGQEVEIAFHLAAIAQATSGDGQRKADFRSGEQRGTRTLNQLAVERGSSCVIFARRGPHRLERRHRLAVGGHRIAFRREENGGTHGRPVGVFDLGVSQGDLGILPSFSLQRPRRFAAGLVLQQPDQRRFAQGIRRILADKQIVHGRGQIRPARVKQALSQFEQHLAASRGLQTASQVLHLTEPGGFRRRGFCQMLEQLLCVSPLLRETAEASHVAGRRFQHVAAAVATRAGLCAAKEVALSDVAGHAIDQQAEAVGLRRFLVPGSQQLPAAAGVVDQRTAEPRGQLRAGQIDAAGRLAAERTVDLFDLPRRQAGRADLLGELGLLAGLLDRGQHGLAHHLAHRIVAARAARLGDDDFRPPDANLPHRVGFQGVAVVGAVPPLPVRRNRAGRESQAGVAEGELPRRLGLRPAHGHDRFVSPLAPWRDAGGRRIRVRSRDDIDHAQIAFVTRQVGEQLQRNPLLVGKDPQQRRAPPPCCWIFHVRPPSRVARIVPSAPTAQPRLRSRKVKARIGSGWPVEKLAQVWPPSGV